MRGKRTNKTAEVGVFRITPAHAGKTLQRKKRMKFDEDHPRACGENIHAESVPCNVGGSPPRMRGKRALLDDFAVFNRITPAHAGKTCSGFVCSDKNRDHPRACGENEG